MLQPFSINSTASQSSSAGCVGGVPLRPKSKTVGDQRLAEVPRPDVVDGHACRQRVAGGRRPICASAARRPVLVFGNGLRRDGVGLQVRFERLERPGQRRVCVAGVARAPCGAASTAPARCRFAACASASARASGASSARARLLPPPAATACCFLRQCRAAGPAPASPLPRGACRRRRDRLPQRGVSCGAGRTPASRSGVFRGLAPAPSSALAQRALGQTACRLSASRPLQVILQHERPQPRLIRLRRQHDRRDRQTAPAASKLGKPGVDLAFLVRPFASLPRMCR